MATDYSRETDGVIGVANPAKALGNVYDARLKRMRATIDYDGQADGDIVVLGDLPVGAVFAFGIIQATATLGGTATLAIGKAGATGKYRAAATFTAVNTPTLFGITEAAAAAPLTAPERVIATIAAAAAPNSTAYMVIDIYYSDLA